MKESTIRKALCLYLVVLLNACLCFPALGEAADSDEETMLSWPFSGEIQDDYASALDNEGAIVYNNEENILTFMTGPMPYGLIANDQDATTVAYDYVTGTNLDMQLLRMDGYNGINCYTFQAMEDNLLLSRCYLKIVTNEAGEILGIASSIPNDTDDVIRNQPDDPFLPQERLNADYVTGTYEATLTTRSGQSLDISIPVLINSEDGIMYLGDNERRIYCVDSSTLENSDGESPVIQPLPLENEMFTMGPVITFYRFLQVYDYFANKGWSSPDGNACPCVLIIDFTGDQDGNAVYGGFEEGCHYFGFGTDDYASQSIQVIAHEFMHGVSATNHIGRYANETGALDEAISDLIGTAVESDIEGKTMEQDVWLQGFKKSHKYGYPMFIWDEYYTPSTDTLDQRINDQGSVHQNSNIVSILAYCQAEAGMTAADRFDYWFLFDLTLTPLTDFPEIAARAAWCAEIAGLSDFAPAMKQAVHDLGLHDRSIPAEPRMDHQALVTIDMIWQESDQPGIITFYNVDTERNSSTWPVAGTNTAAAVLSEGTYIISIVIHSEPEAYFLWNGEDWQPCGQEEIEKAREEADDIYRVLFGRGDVVTLGDFRE